MSKRRPPNGKHIGDKDLNFDPRKKYAQKKIKQLNIDSDNKYNASKIELPSSVQKIFDEVNLYEQDANICRDLNV